MSGAGWSWTERLLGAAPDGTGRPAAGLNGVDRGGLDEADGTNEAGDFDRAHVFDPDRSERPCDGGGMGKMRSRGP